MTDGPIPTRFEDPQLLRRTTEMLVEEIAIESLEDPANDPISAGLSRARTYTCLLDNTNLIAGIRDLKLRFRTGVSSGTHDL